MEECSKDVFCASSCYRSRRSIEIGRWCVQGQAKPQRRAKMWVTTLDDDSNCGSSQDKSRYAITRNIINSFFFPFPFLLRSFAVPSVILCFRMYMIMRTIGCSGRDARRVLYKDYSLYTH
ncbi:hypothetical protein RB195_012741 [Necator americanus]|uniref:G-protein coupled receptors family 1 profile domain-containing protein n=1 Tax=Necator americanus TaxID=51031 RepID=A0ABR1DSF9_NECAM